MIEFSLSNLLKNAVAYYPDLRLGQKSQFLEIYKKRAGIYGIYNKKEDMIYIGSAKNLWKRLTDHLRMKRIYSNSRLVDAFLIQGVENFGIVVLVSLSPSHTVTQKNLLENENFYFELIPKEKLYNIQPKAMSSFFGQKHSETTKKQLSLALSGLKNPMYGKKHSIETKKQWSLERRGALNPMYGREKYAEFLSNMGNLWKGKAHPQFGKGIALSVWTTENIYVGDFKTLNQVVRQLKISKKTIHKYLRLRQPYVPKKSPFGYLFYFSIPS
jgi:group I intron endonuclease